MQEQKTTKTPAISRRTVVKAAATSAFAGMVIPPIYAYEDNTIRIALVGCGGRGTGAVHDAFTAKAGPVKLHAMADVFSDRLESSAERLEKAFPDRFEANKDRRFVGFEAYKAAVDLLKPGDIAIFATPPAFRWAHFGYAIQKGVNVFMEKPVTVDGPSTRRMLALATQSENKKLKVGVGLMCRHCSVRQELHDKIKDGLIGDILALRAYRMHGPVGTALTKPMPKGQNELEFQIRNFHGFLWASGGCYSDFYIHNIDESCWMKDAWPVKAQGNGGRTYRDGYIDQNFDAYSVEYTFGDGTKLFFEGRTMDGCHQEFSSYAHGSKGSAIISQSGHFPTKARAFKGQNFVNSDVIWRGPKDEPNPYHLEWQHLLDAIRQDKPYNEARRGAEASLVTAMGRMACHSGKVITYDEALNSEQDLGGEVDKLTINGPAPVRADANGKYPIPQPGKTGKREF